MCTSRVASTTPCSYSPPFSRRSSPLLFLVLSAGVAARTAPPRSQIEAPKKKRRVASLLSVLLLPLPRLLRFRIVFVVFRSEVEQQPRANQKRNVKKKEKEGGRRAAKGREGEGKARIRRRRRRNDEDDEDDDDEAASKQGGGDQQTKGRWKSL